MHPPTGGVSVPSAICRCSARSRRGGYARPSKGRLHPPLDGSPPSFHVNVAVAYGGRQEIVDAVRALLNKELVNGVTGEQLVEAVTVEAISENLYTSGQPDPDLVIRTSGEQRLSGFLLWQSAYSEMWYTEAHWPAFRRVDFLRALRDYSRGTAGSET